MRIWIVLASIALATSLASPAAAQDAPDAAIAAARELVLYARYPEAIAAGEELLARGDLSAAQHNAALELIATAQLANRQSDDARRTLATLYARDPGHRLSDADASPPVISAFARAREAQPGPIAVELQHRSPGTLARREPPSIEVRAIEGADAIAEMRLAYRTAGEPGFSQVVMNARSGGVWVGRIPVVGSSDRAIDVAYYVLASAPSGAELASVGSEGEPLQLRVPAEVPDPRGVAIAAIEGSQRIPVDGGGGGGGSVVEEAWFWIVIGVLVAGGVTAGVLVGTADPGGPDQGTLGTVTLMR
ncbi:MAG: hypothetical protein M3Y87_26590 [Myxococcota bacterium]|nr:hypothetical protein [Myxococcota bacterium]